MKKLFLLIFAVLLVLGSALPLAAYRVTRAVLGHTEPLPAASSAPELPASQPNALPSADAGNTFWGLSPPKCRSADRTRHSRHRLLPPTPTRSTAGIMPPCKAVHGSPLILPGVRAV